MPLDLEKVLRQVREAIDHTYSAEVKRILGELERDITTELLTTPIRGVALQTDPGDT